MRAFAMIVAACAASTLSWSAPAHPVAIATATEKRLPHISVMTMGRGDPVVLIPGLSTPRAVWDELVPQLAKSHEVLLVQVNGFAGDDPDANTKAGILDGIATDLHAYLATRGLSKASVIGHSMGGLAALKFAKAYPGDVSKLMIVDALPFFAVLMDSAATAEAVKPTAEMMRAKVASAYGKPADPATVEANVKSLALKPASIARMKQWAGAADPRVVGQALYEDLTTDLRPDLASIKAPATIIVPWTTQQFGQDRTLGFYKRQYAGMPNAAFVGIGDAGHFVMLDQPERFAAAIEEFLR